MTIDLRPWQSEAIKKCKEWFEIRKSNKFIINAAPGSGKTYTALVIAKELLRAKRIDKVVVVAPSNKVVKQWSVEAKNILGSKMMKVSGGDKDDLLSYGTHYSTTWQSLKSLLDAFHTLCRTYKTLVICDEQHHAASDKSWGKSVIKAFEESAKYELILTGTPYRSDGKDAVWLETDKDSKKIVHPIDGTYVLTYGEAVALGYCRPVTFHKHEGNFIFDFLDGDKVEISGKTGPKLNDEQRKKIKRIPLIDKAMDFYNLATTVKHLNDNPNTPDLSSYMSTMIKEGVNKLEQVRFIIPDAGGLVIAPDIQTANHMAQIIEHLTNEKPVVVHNKEKGSNNKLNAFEDNKEMKWLVSVQMVSEGVDIPRLRVLVYLPTAMTELFFRQAIGRVVRNYIPNDNTRAYVIMPAYKTFEVFAERVEREMPAKFRKDSNRPKKKVCPDCHSDCNLNASECSECGHEFPQRTPQFKMCAYCGGMNLLNAETCQHCGENMTHEFGVTLDSAMRDGVLVRGMTISEDEAQEGERMADHLNDLVMSSGDEVLIKLMRSYPEESYARIAKYIEVAREKVRSENV